MTITATIGYVLAGLLAAAIIFIGARFLVAPRVAAAGYGVLPLLDQPGSGAYLNVKGGRESPVVMLVTAALLLMSR
jgi:hypothetical protein